MAKAKQQGAAKKNARAAYKSENRYEKNRRARLERALKKQPNNEQIKDALKNIKYRRYIPKNKYGWVSSKDVRFNPSADQNYTGPGISGGHYRFLAQQYKITNNYSKELEYNRDLKNHISAESKALVAQFFEADSKVKKAKKKKHQKKKAVESTDK